MNKPEVRIKNWFFSQDPGNGYTAPELLPIRLHGNALGHYNYPTVIPGEFVTTTVIKAFNIAEGWVESQNTRYILVGPENKLMERKVIDDES